MFAHALVQFALQDATSFYVFGKGQAIVEGRKLCATNETDEAPHVRL